jgi:hypothetical protein
VKNRRRRFRLAEPMKNYLVAMRRLRQVLRRRFSQNLLVKTKVR